MLCCGKLIFTNKFSTGNFLVKCTNKCKILYLQSMKTFDQVCIYSKLFCRFELRIAIATKIFFLTYFKKFICSYLYRDLDNDIQFANYLKKCNLFHFTLTKQFPSQKIVCLTPLYLTG